MEWEKGTYFSIAVFGSRGYWKVIENTNDSHALCKHIKGSDPRAFKEPTWVMLKVWYKTGGRKESWWSTINPFN